MSSIHISSSRRLLLALAFTGCGGSPSPAVTPPPTVSPAPSSAPAASGPAVPRQARTPDDDAATLARVRELRDLCPGAFVRNPAPACELSLYQLPRGGQPPDGNETRRVRTLARLVLEGEPDSAGIAYFLLAIASHAVSESAPGQLTPPRWSVCSDRSTSALLLDAYDAYLTRARRGDGSATEATDFSALVACADVDALGIGDRLRAMAIRARERHDVPRLGAAAFFFNPASADMTRLYLEDFSASDAEERSLLALGLEQSFAAGRVAHAAVLCQGLLPHVLDPDDAVSQPLALSFAYANGGCRAHRDDFLALVEKQPKATPRPFLTSVIRSLWPLCEDPALTPAQRRRASDLASSLADPRNPAGDDRAFALQSLCVCDKARARPLVRRATTSKDEHEREVATGNVCR